MCNTVKVYAICNALHINIKQSYSNPVCNKTID